MRAARGILAAAALALAASCGEEIDSRPARAAAAAERSAEPAARPLPESDTVPEAPPAAAAADAEERYRTHLYSERDADVYALLDENTSLGSAASVKALQVELGDRVRAGQVLAVLDDARPRLAVRAAEARAEELRGQLTRTEQLRAKGFATAAEHERLTHAYAEAAADLEQVRLDLSRTRVLAPFAGVVARRYVRVGERVDDSTPLFRVTAMSPLRARLLVPETRAGAFRPGGSVALTSADGTHAEGTVVLVGPTVDPASGTREVVVQVPGGSGFLPGGEVVAQPPAADPVPARDSVPGGSAAPAGSAAGDPGGGSRG